MLHPSVFSMYSDTNYECLIKITTFIWALDTVYCSRVRVEKVKIGSKAATKIKLYKHRLNLEMPKNLVHGLYVEGN